MSSENNNNGDNNKDENKKDKKMLRRIKDRQGFYTILILCLIIVAITALWVDNQKEGQFIGEGPTNPFGEDEQPEVTLVEDDDKSAEGTQEIGKIGEGKPADSKKPPVIDSKEKPATDSNAKPKEDKSVPKKDSSTKVTKESTTEKHGETGETKGTSTPEETKETSTSEKTKETSASEDAKEASATVVMAMPVTGKLILPFADDRLIYHKTLDQWSTHKGIDIKAEEGAPVKAALDGEVVEIVNDTIMGITIVIRHNKELSTIYSNLSTDAMVEIGEHVKKGQTISGVGKTASVKTLEGPLLHFQVLRDDKLVNPELYLGAISRT